MIKILKLKKQETSVAIIEMGNKILAFHKATKDDDEINNWKIKLMNGINNKTKEYAHKHWAFIRNKQYTSIEEAVSGCLYEIETNEENIIKRKLKLFWKKITKSK